MRCHTHTHTRDAEEVKTKMLMMMKKVATRLCELIMIVGNELFTWAHTFSHSMLYFPFLSTHMQLKMLLRRIWNMDLIWIKMKNCMFFRFLSLAIALTLWSQSYVRLLRVGRMNLELYEYAKSILHSNKTESPKWLCDHINLRQWAHWNSIFYANTCCCS